MQSGSPYSFWAAHSNLSVDYENYVKKLAQKIGCKRSLLDEVVECLRFVDVEKLDIRLLQEDGVRFEWLFCDSYASIFDFLLEFDFEFRNKKVISGLYKYLLLKWQSPPISYVLIVHYS